MLLQSMSAWSKHFSNYIGKCLRSEIESAKQTFKFVGSCLCAVCFTKYEMYSNWMVYKENIYLYLNKENHRICKSKLRHISF